jgi:hypothetical protein
VTDSAPLSVDYCCIPKYRAACNVVMMRRRISASVFLWGRRHIHSGSDEYARENIDKMQLDVYPPKPMPHHERQSLVDAGIKVPHGPTRSMSVLTTSSLSSALHLSIVSLEWRKDGEDLLIPSISRLVRGEFIYATQTGCQRI